MKKLIFILSIISLLSFNSNSNHYIKPINKIEKKSNSGDKYRVTAKTRHLYGQNYWIDLIVDANVGVYGSTIYGVYYDSGNGYKRVSYNSIFGEDDTYSVYIDYETYYFVF